MSMLDRRRMLLGLAAASTAAAGPVVAANASLAENAELARLGGLTTELVSTYRSAKAAREAVVAEWEPQFPSVPKEIHTLGGLGEVAYDLEWQWPRPYARFLTADHLRRRAADMREPVTRRKGTSPATIAKYQASRDKWAAEYEAQAVLSEIYCAERDRVRAASGIRPAQAIETKAREALIDHVAKVMQAAPLTMAGVVIQAEALDALRSVPVFQRGTFSVDLITDLPAWGERLAASIIRLAGGAQS